MRNLLRKPLPWMVIAECAIVGALAMVAWHMVVSPPVSQIAAAEAPSPTTKAREPASPPSKKASAKPPARALSPGLNVDSNFWKQRLAELNGNENSFVQLEWRIVHSAMDAARRYIKAVALPAVIRAERAGG